MLFGTHDHPEAMLRRSDTRGWISDFECAAPVLLVSARSCADLPAELRTRNSLSDADRLTKSPSRTRRCGSAAAEAAGGSSATVAEQTKQYHEYVESRVVIVESRPSNATSGGADAHDHLRIIYLHARCSKSDVRDMCLPGMISASVCRSPLRFCNDEPKHLQKVLHTSTMAKPCKSHLGVHVVDTADADHEHQLRLVLDVEAAALLRLPPKANLVRLLRFFIFKK